MGLGRFSIRSVARRAAAVALVATISTYSAFAQTESTPTEVSPSSGGGRVTLEVADLPPASVEMDLGPGLIRQFFSMGDAAVAGFLEGLSTSPDAESSDNIQFVAKQLTSARELGDVASEVVQEVHIRAWNEEIDGQEVANKLIEQYDATLPSNGWEPTLRARQDGELVRIYTLREGESVTGVLVVAGKRNELAVINVVGDLSPDNIQRLVSTATKIGVQLGLDKEINKGIGKLRMEIERKHSH